MKDTENVKSGSEVGLQKLSTSDILVIGSIGQTIASSIDLDKIIDAIYENINRIIDAPIFGIALYHETTKDIEFRLLVEDSIRKPLFRVNMENDKSFAVQCVKKQSDLILNYIEPNVERVLNETGENARIPESLIFVPLIIMDKIIGVLTVQSYMQYAYTQQDMTSVKALASYIAIALNNSQKTEALKIAEREKVIALSHMVAGIAHEMNTPLGVSVSAASYITSINEANLQKLKSGSMTKTDLTNYMTGMDETLKLLNTSLSRTAELVNSFKKIADDQDEKNRMYFDLHEYIQMIIMNLKAEVGNLGHECIINCPKALGINSYPDAFYQIFYNLIMNSVKIGFQNKEKGTITIDVKKSNAVLNIEFSDNGCGIPAENLSRVFEPFFTTSRLIGGKGLGLNVVYNLITNLLQGKISCESTVGVGTKYTMEIPDIE